MENVPIDVVPASVVPMDAVPTYIMEKAVGRLTGMIGMARRAGRLNWGFEAVLEEIASRKAKAVLLSNDASPRTSGKIKDACIRCRVRLAVVPVSKALLGRSIGRDDIAVISIGEKKFADRILELASASERSDPDGQTDSGSN